MTISNKTWKEAKLTSVRKSIAVMIMLVQSCRSAPNDLIKNSVHNTGRNIGKWNTISIPCLMQTTSHNSPTRPVKCKPLLFLPVKILLMHWTRSGQNYPWQCELLDVCHKPQKGLKQTTIWLREQRCANSDWSEESLDMCLPGSSQLQLHALSLGLG